MPPRAPGSAPAALLLLACVTMVMATQASAAATWKVELVPTPITRDTYEATTTLPATCFKISQTGKCGAGSSRCCCNAPPPSTLSIKNVARACARTSKPPAFTVDGIPQDGAKSARYFGKGAAKLSGANSNSPSLALALPAWATGQTERVVCISTSTGACGTFAKICNNRPSCPVTLSGTGSCSKTSKCMSAAASIKTAPLATATHAMVLGFADATKPCADGSSTLFEQVANGFEKDVRAQLASELGSAIAKKITTIDFSPQFCSAAGGNRQGLVGFVTVTGPPDIVDDVLVMLDRDAMPSPTATAAMCQDGGGSSCGKEGAVVEASFAPSQSGRRLAVAGDDPTLTAAYADLLQTFQTSLATGFNVLQYDPPGGYANAPVTSINTANWLTSGKIYDMASIATACAQSSCFDGGTACGSGLSAKVMTSSAERQDDLFASVNVDARFAGITGSANGAFKQSQSKLESSNSLSVLTTANCYVLNFRLPTGTAAFSKEFVNNVRSALIAISAARNQTATDPEGAKTTILNGLDTLYQSYGTHAVQSLSYGGFMRLEVLVNTQSLRTNYTSEASLNLAMQHAVADVVASGGKNSSETTALFASTSAYSYVTVPASPQVPLLPIEGGGYKIDNQNWTANLVESIKVGSLYPSVVRTQELSGLLRQAASRDSDVALKLGDIEDYYMVQMSNLSVAYDAYVRNDASAWNTTYLPMPQLLQNPNYFTDGQCSKSDLLARVNQKSDFGASFTCVTCVDGVSTLPSDPLISIANPDNTKSCTVDPDGSLESVKAVCKTCNACSNQNCSSRDGGTYTGMWVDTAKCEICVQCQVDTDCGWRNGVGGEPGGPGGSYLGGHGQNGEHASCRFVNLAWNCLQCVNDRDCKDGKSCYNWNCNN